MATIVGERLAHYASRAHDVPAWIDGERSIGYGEVAGDVAALAAWLVADGVARSRVVGISLDDDRRNAVASLALFALGIPQVTLPTTDPRAQREALARRVGVDRIVTDLPALPRRAGGVSALRADPDAPAMYVTSSGTTGRPKLLAYTQRAIALRSASACEVERHGTGERVYVPAGGQGFLSRMSRLYTFLEGATWVFHDGNPSAAAAVARAAHARASIVHLSALVATRIAADDATPRLDRGVKVFSATSRLPASAAGDFERRTGVPLYDRYGASEVGVLSVTYPRGGEGVPDSVGRIVPGATVEIVDERGVALPPGTVGEIRARTPQMTAGYVDDPELTRHHFRDGWFHPGDAGAITPEGVLRFLGRCDDMMSLGGFNVFPTEIERVLDAHPAVQASAAFPRRSPVYGDIPVAAVELRARGAPTAAELAAYARARLGLRAPRRVEVLDALPRNAAGKVDKAELAKLVRSDPDA
jgi:acyl-CoA synthetase (AMP-forming)/AMP-acid ligase II